MVVRELIARLAECDPDAEVMVSVEQQHTFRRALSERLGSFEPGDIVVDSDKIVWLRVWR